MWCHRHGVKSARQGWSGEVAPGERWGDITSVLRPRLAGARFCDFWRVVFVEEEDVDDDEGGADGDGGVGDVEGGPVVGAEPDFEEVGDGAVDDAIGYVASGAAE